MLNNKKTYDPEFLNDWPVHFYELTDPSVREKCLKEYLKFHPDSEADRRRQEIFQHRYGSSFSKQDNYYYAWCMLKAVSESTTFMNRSHRENQLRKYFIDLAVLSSKFDDLQEKEWENFAADFIHRSIRGSSYGTKMLGLGRVSEHDKACRIANDIRTITVSLPREIYLEKNAEPLKKILEKTFISEIEDGAEIIASIH